VAVPHRVGTGEVVPSGTWKRLPQHHTWPAVSTAHAE
jgi:hypothetical protein